MRHEAIGRRHEMIGALDVRCMHLPPRHLMPRHGIGMSMAMVASLVNTSFNAPGMATCSRLSCTGVCTQLEKHACGTPHVGYSGFDRPRNLATPPQTLYNAFQGDQRSTHGYGHFEGNRPYSPTLQSRFAVRSLQDRTQSGLAASWAQVESLPGLPSM